ncbi:MAG: glycosyltransferase family 4 protein [bacterium]
MAKSETRNPKHLVLLVTNDFPPIVSGISTYFYQLCKRASSDGLILLVPRQSGATVAADFPAKIIRRWCPVGESRVAKYVKTFLNIFWTVVAVKRHPIGKILCGQILSNGLAGLLCKRWFGLPFVVFVYGSETLRLGSGRLGRRLLQTITAQAEQVVVNSEFTRREYLHFGVAKSKLVKISPGVDVEIFKPGDKNKALLRRLHLNGEKILLSVSRLDERKGHRQVLHSLKQWSGQPTRVKYLVVGTGREEGRLKDLVRDLDLQETVVFTGPVPDQELAQYYRLCDIFVLPNCETHQDPRLRGDYEGFGIVFLEAAACGKPVIAGLSGGVEDAVVHNQTGLLVEPQNTRELTAAIERLVENPELCARMGRCGRRRAVAEFNWDDLARKFERLLC